MPVVVVESPAKAKTINRYLGTGYTVLASYGHVRDLPSKDGSVKPDDDFAMSWDVDARSAKRLSDIAEALKGADRLILATLTARARRSAGMCSRCSIAGRLSRASPSNGSCSTPSPAPPSPRP
jgi:hypothetical protein